MSMKPTLASLFPNASASTVAANPHLVATSTGSGNKNESMGILEPRRGKRGGMNKTESEFALQLEAQKRNGEILRYEFEGIRLVWLGNMHYTPDFVVFMDCGLTPGPPPMNHIRLIEVKGGHIWDRDIVRFKGARAYWPEFSFEMWQKTKQGWIRKF